MIEPEIYKAEDNMGYHAVINIDSLSDYHGYGLTKEIARQKCIDLYEERENKKGGDE